MNPGGLGSDHYTMWSPTHFTATTMQAGFDSVLHITDGNLLPRGKITFQNHSASDPWINDVNVRQIQNSSQIREENRLQKMAPFVHSSIHPFVHSSCTQHTSLDVSQGPGLRCMLWIQTEISHDPFVQELTSPFGDMLQAGRWTKEEGEGTGGRGVH